MSFAQQEDDEPQDGGNDPFLEQRKLLAQQLQQRHLQSFQKQLQQLSGQKRGSDEVEDDGPPKRQRVSSKMCDLFVMGGCTKGDSCPHAHFESELIKFPQIAAPQEEAQAAQSTEYSGSGDASWSGMAQQQWSSSGGAAGYEEPQQQYHDWDGYGSSGGTASAQQQSEQQKKEMQHKYKLALCQFHQQGRCRKGDQCTFAHGEHELRAPEGRRQTGQTVVQGIPQAGYKPPQQEDSKSQSGARQSCWFYERGWCTKGTGCKFTHDEQLGPRPDELAEAAAAAQSEVFPQQTAAAQATQMRAAWGQKPEQQYALTAGGELDTSTMGTTTEDIAQAALLYQQAVQGLRADPEHAAAATVAAAAATSASDSVEGYDAATLAAAAQWQELQQSLLSQAAQEMPDTSSMEGLDASGMDAATSAAYSAAWAAALQNAGLLPSTATALQTAASSAGAGTAAAIAAAAAAAAEYRQTLLLAQAQSQGAAGAAAGMDQEAAAAAVAGSTRKNYKMQMCKFFPDGKCVKGAFCPYAHGNEEVLAASLRAARVEAAMREGSRNDVCYDFRDRGKCRFGITCKFSHNL